MDCDRSDVQKTIQQHRTEEKEGQQKIERDREISHPPVNVYAHAVAGGRPRGNELDLFRERQQPPRAQHVPLRRPPPQRCPVRPTAEENGARRLFRPEEEA